MVWLWKYDQLEWLSWQYPTILDALCDPIIRIDFAREVMLHTQQFLFFLRVPIIVEMLFGYQTRHNSKAFNDISYLATMRKYSKFFQKCLQKLTKN